MDILRSATALFVLFALSFSLFAEGYGGDGTTEQVTGTVESYNDDLLVISHDMMRDSIIVTDTTRVMIDGKTMDAEDLETDTPVRVWYRMDDGRKIATKITDTTYTK